MMSRLPRSCGLVWTNCNCFAKFVNYGRMTRNYSVLNGLSNNFESRRLLSSTTGLNNESKRCKGFPKLSTDPRISEHNNRVGLRKCAGILPKILGINAPNSQPPQCRQFHVDPDPIHPRPTGGEANSTVDPSEIGRFSELSRDWWNEFGPMKALHSMNDVRVPWIRDRLAMIDKQDRPAARPLSGFRLLDVGCGAGLLSEPLARLGADVTGLDASADLIDVANRHGRHLTESGNDVPNHAASLRYMASSVEDLAGEIAAHQHPQYDAVVASEILEHVASREAFLAACMGCLRPGGLLFVTTLNRTMMARVLGIWAAENVLGIVPAGVHEWDKFTTPGELESMVERLGGLVKLVHGLGYNPFTNHWRWCSDRSINYALLAEKM